MNLDRLQFDVTRATRAVNNCVGLRLCVIQTSESLDCRDAISGSTSGSIVGQNLPLDGGAFNSAVG